MGFISSENGMGDMRSSISSSVNDRLGSESYDSRLPRLHDDHLQSHELDPHLLIPFNENDTSLEEIREEWICLHFDPEISSRAYAEEPPGIEDHDENFLGGKSTGTHSNLNFGGSVGGFKCNRSWDGILCWPETPEGRAATLSCFSHLNGIQYDTSRTVSRICEEGGVWQNITNYTSCVPMTGSQVPDEGLGVTIHVYFFGYCLSLTALIIAMIIFLSFKELRCLRNKIHTNLIVTYILAGTLWIITNFTTAAQSMSQKGNNVSSRVSCITFILLHYFHLTNFFMMFVEGLYLYVLVVQTFMAENIKLRVYAAIGWGIPLLIMAIWTITKWLTQPGPPDTLVGGEVDPEFLVACFIGVAEDMYDWIYKAPVVLCLFANVLFLVRIMWVLITKLRSATSPETQQSRKAAKALIVLMPLLGITYVFILTGPKKLPTFEHLRALLISTQGFLVALLYCFLNGEVRIALRHRWNRWNCCWQEGIGNNGRSKGNCCSKLLHYAGCCCCCQFCWWDKAGRRRRHNQYVRDLSPNSRSRTESNYFESTNHAYRKRASSSSEATTMSTFSFSGRSSVVNGLPFLQPPNPAAAKRLSMLATSPRHIVNPDVVLSI